MRHIIALLMENEAGALSRVAGLFSARGYNIESLTVAPTEDATLSRMTIVTVGSEDVVEQIIKQLNKLVDVVKVLDLTDGSHIERELMLVKVRASSVATAMLATQECASKSRTCGVTSVPSRTRWSVKSPLSV